MIWIESRRKPEGKRAPIVRAPFGTAPQALGALLFFAAAMAAPLLIERLAPADPGEIYRGVPATYGNYYTIGAELQKPGDIDVLIVGGSDAWTALDPRIIKFRLEEKYNRPIRVVNFSTNWAGEERNAQIVLDALKGRSVRLVLVPENDAAQQVPHELAKYWWRSEIDTAGLSPPERLQFYMMAVLGAPRQLWARFQPQDPDRLLDSYGDYFEQQTMRLGFNSARTGWKSHYETDESKRRAYEEKVAPTISVAVDDLFYDGPGDGDFEERPYTYTRVQSHFIKKTKDLVEENGGIFASFSIPTHFQNAVLDKPWLRGHPDGPRDWPTIGISMRALFAGLSFEEMLDFYTNESHLNASGAVAYTEAMLPAIEKLYADANPN